MELITMKRIAIALTLLVTSCVSSPDLKSPETEELPLDNTIDRTDQNYRVYTLEGCEYIVVGRGDQKWGSHKGNCKNPIHKNQ